jgi:hypothetical protein
MLEGQEVGVHFQAGARDFSLLHNVQTGSEAHPATYPVCTRNSSSEVKLQRHEADQSPSPSPKVKDGWAIPPFPHTHSRCGD